MPRPTRLISVATNAPASTTGKVGRNALCPCGSGRKFKQCCASSDRGIVISPPQAPPTRQLIDEALVNFRQGRLGESEALALRTLGGEPDHPEALALLGAIRYRQVRFDEAMDLVGRANDLTDWRLPGFVNQYGLLLSELITGLDAGSAAKRRVEYRAWLDRPRVDLAKSPSISIVLIAFDNTAYIDATLESIYRQSYRHLELVVVEEGANIVASEAIRASLARSPFPSKLLSIPRRGLAASLNEGIALTQADYINPCTANDLLPPGRIESMIEAIVSRGHDWGFGFNTSASTGPNEPASNVHAGIRSNLSTRIAESAREQDTLGTSLLIHNLAGSLGNLFFSRTLFDELDGFREHGGATDWDFCLRALWRCEPIPVPGTEVEQSPTEIKAAPLDRTASAQEQAVILASYHQTALADSPPNPFAPAIHTMGPRYFILPLRHQHATLLPAHALRDLAKIIKDKHRAGRHLPATLEDEGINILGYLRAESGLGESSRAYALACLDQGIRVTLRDADINIPSIKGDFRMDPWLADRMRAKTTLLCINPDWLRRIWELHGPAEFENQYLIGFWYWELERFPSQWRYALDVVDEVWVASEFVRAAVARETDKPVIKLPYPVHAKPDRLYRRAEFKLPEGRFLFLYSFDFSSYRARKNPDAALIAFKEAFPPSRNDVGLVIKCSGGHKHPTLMADLLGLIDGDPRIQIIDGVFSIDRMHGLQDVCDAYLSLHRSEGLGLGIAESMALGKPVIATRYSGNLEFMHDANSCLVDYSLVPVRPGEYLHHEHGAEWAEADIEHAAFFMRRLVEDREFKEGLAARAAADIAQKFNNVGVAEAIRARLACIHSRTAKNA